MKVLVPLLTGKEKESTFVEAFTTKVDEIVLLQIIDKEFMGKTGSAIGELRQSRAVMEEVKKIIGQKKKKYSEITEWGSTIKKIISISVLQNVDKVYFVNQNNQFFQDILKELKKNKVQYELVDVVEKEDEKE